MRHDFIEIRAANYSDASMIALLGRITFSETFAHHFRDPEDLMQYFECTFSVSKIELSIAKSTTRYWIAFVDRLPVGYAKLKLDSPSPFLDLKGVCQLQKLYVLKDFQSVKIGFHLQSKLIETATSLNYQYIWLSVLDENVSAIRFYKHSGFLAIGEHDFQIGKEHFNFTVMSKPLY